MKNNGNRKNGFNRIDTPHLVHFGKQGAFYALETHRGKIKT